MTIDLTVEQDADGALCAEISADQAEQRVLWDVEAMLEKILLEPLSPDHASGRESARAAVRDNTDGDVMESRHGQASR